MASSLLVVALQDSGAFDQQVNIRLLSDVSDNSRRHWMIIAYRAQVWTYGVITFPEVCFEGDTINLFIADCHSSNLCEGLPPLAVPFHQADELSKATRAVLEDKLAYHVKIYRILVEVNLIVANGLDPGGNNEDTALNTNILTFDEQLQGIHHNSGSNQSKFISRIHRSLINIRGQ